MIEAGRAEGPGLFKSSASCLLGRDEQSRAGIETVAQGDALCLSLRFVVPQVICL
jgi:hypothetical protein